MKNWRNKKKFKKMLDRTPFDLSLSSTEKHKNFIYFRSFQFSTSKRKKRFAAVFKHRAVELITLARLKDLLTLSLYLCWMRKACGANGEHKREFQCQQTKKQVQSQNWWFVEMQWKSFLKDFNANFNGISTMRVTNKSSVPVSLKYLIVALSLGVRNLGE